MSRWVLVFECVLVGACFNPSPADDDGSTGAATAPGDTDGSDGDATDPGVDTGGNDSSTGGGVPCDGACDANATCENDTCVCGPGFEGDGTTCTDIDGCAGVSCFDGVDCIDEPAPGEGYSCGECPSGYEGDGMTCADADGCAGDPCFDGVACTDVPAPGEGFTCDVCPPGYEGDGESCADIDGCAPPPCFPGVTCSDVPAPEEGFSCGACPGGMFGDGIVCYSEAQYNIGTLQNSNVDSGPYFRGNGFVANGDGWLVAFDQHLGLGANCDLDFYVFEAVGPGSPLNQLWRTTLLGGVGSSYRSSGPIDIPVFDGMYYVLGMAWNCPATYYWNTTGAFNGFDAGIGIFEDTRWDNGYPGASDLYVPPGQQVPPTVYAQHIYFAG